MLFFSCLHAIDLPQEAVVIFFVKGTCILKAEPFSKDEEEGECAGLQPPFEAEPFYQKEKRLHLVRLAHLTRRRGP